MIEPSKPTPEECYNALRDMLNAYASTVLETPYMCDAYTQAGKVANKLHRRMLWESLQSNPALSHAR